MLRSLCIIGCLVAMISDTSAGNPIDFREAIRAALPATVAIRLDSDQSTDSIVEQRILRRRTIRSPAVKPIDDWFQARFDETDHSLRAGFAVAPDLIVTINVPPGSKEVEVLTGRQDTLSGQVVVRDHVTGLAAIRVNDGSFATLPIGVDSPEAGLAVVITWLREGKHPISDAAMIASGPNSLAASLGFTHEVDTDLAPSVVGAPVLDSSGVVVGVIAQPRPSDEHRQGTICLPAAALTRLIEAANQPEPKDLERGLVGIRFGDNEDGGAVVQSVIDDSPAAKAQILSGDVIVRVNEDEIESHWSVVAAVAQARAGDEVTVVVNRDGETLEQTVKLAAQPERYVAARNPAESLQQRMFGFQDGKLVPLQQFDGPWSFEDFQRQFGNQPPQMDMVVPVPKPKVLDPIQVGRSKLEQAIQQLEAEKKRQDAKIRELTEKIESLHSDAAKQHSDRVDELIDEIQKRLREQDPE